MWSIFLTLHSLDLYLMTCVFGRKMEVSTSPHCPSPHPVLVLLVGQCAWHPTDSGRPSRKARV